MNITDAVEWQRTSPLAAIFYLGKIYEAIAKNLFQTIAPLVALLFASQGDLMDKVLFGGIAIVAVTLTAAILRYWFFRFCIADDSILIRDGVIRKTQLDIKFDRIQAINTQQNFVFKFFDLVTVKLDTAGSAKQEGNLPAIRSALATSLKDRIRRELSGNVERPAADDDHDAPEAEAKTILRLGPRDMVRIGLSSNRALIFLAFLAPVINSVTEGFEEKVEENAVATAVEAAQLSVSTGISIALLLVIGFLLLLVLASVAGAFLRYHNFTLLADSGVLRSIGGLLTRHEHSVKFAKIQALYVTQNPVMRLFKRLRLDARQASSGRPGAEKQFIVPLTEPGKLPDICNEVFGKEFPDIDLNPVMSRYQRISPRFVRSRVILTGVLPAVLLTGLVSLAAGFYALVLLIWIPLDALLVWTIYRKHAFCVAADGMLVRSGFLGFRVAAFAHRKVQRVSVTQTRSQRRKGLATLRVFLASGSIKLPYINHLMAQQLRDYMLYKVESSEAAWH